MKTSKKQLIEKVINDNFVTYPSRYPVGDNEPSEDAICELFYFVKEQFENDDSENKGSMDEWLKIAVSEYLRYFDEYFQETKAGENRRYIINQMRYLQWY